jgi:dephospho-CoA kinase
MKVVGLTGGIGSGKTSVLQLFINKGIPVYIADIEAKRLMQSDVEIKEKILAAFGGESYQNGKLNRAYLAKMVFKDKKKLHILNQIVHPVVHQDFLHFLSKQRAPFIIYENAILFENGSNQWCDYIITVTAPVETRIQRVINRDKVTAQQVKDRMSHQWDEQLKIKQSDFIIENINWETTEKATQEIYEQLLKLTTEKDKES